MSTVIPQWNMHGVLPHIIGHGDQELRSPYRVSLPDVIHRFGNYPDRTLILDGFLKFRERLHTLGLVEGYQWLDGSFVEDSELLLNRQPGDIDVVTFYKEPSGLTQAALLANDADLFSFDADKVKARKDRYKVDSYMFSLTGDPKYLHAQTCLWHDTWSIRRNNVRKGYVSIDLDPKDDNEATALVLDLKNKYKLP
ncbi:MAG TPA: hypothetical protein PKE53_17080 [Flavobacteriales bacterium]|jgi:hypothetical protein|nr:hypothetical protein [Flavobacteriales bacterium]HMU15704.1 hypothetical protein [Flavobacteriales bacterium]HMW96558.1 hypothetical protein [Flavobacteriales bacterium]HMZ50441.1 hypothetical protein [Flavobacteriales bacterium]HNA31973.1 hypothetical protein [Flavobacteriales bacterium]